MEKTSPQEKKNTFSITFNKEFKGNGDILEYGNIPFKVKSEPIWKYNKWYHTILYYLTFKQRFVKQVSYEIELL